MADWDFVEPEEEKSYETHRPLSKGLSSVMEMRPTRMGLGCSREDIQERISQNAKKARLKKLLVRAGHEEGEETLSSSISLGFERAEEETKASVSKTTVMSSSTSISPEQIPSLTKNQKKRLRKRQREAQNRVIHR
jgi:hypothetical protein